MQRIGRTWNFYTLNLVAEKRPQGLKGLNRPISLHYVIISTFLLLLLLKFKYSYQQSFLKQPAQQSI